MASQSSNPSQQQQHQPYPYDYQQQHPQYYTNQQLQEYYQTQYYHHHHQTQYYANQDSSIYPPGVPISDPNCGIEYQNQQNGYYYQYSNNGVSDVALSSENYGQSNQITQASNAVASGTGYSSSNVNGQGHFSTTHGQEHAVPLSQSVAPIPVPAPQLIQPSYRSAPSISNKRVKPKGRKLKTQQPCQPAYCELCKVDCNSLEIFEQHKNGKKHQKNLKNDNVRQTLNKVLVEGQTARASDVHKPEIQPQMVVNTEEKMAIEAIGPEESAAMKIKKTSLEAQGSGLKRKMKNGKAAKLIKANDGSKRPVEPKPKVVPLICELCNVKCESPMVFQTHLTGKKHLTNIKRFHGEQALLGQAAVEALYPALQVWGPALQALFKGDMSTLISELQQQGYLDAQAQPVPATHLQGQGSETPAAAAVATLSEIPQSSVFPQQQSDLPLEFSGAATASQAVVAVPEINCDEQSVPVPVATTTGAENELTERK